MQLGKHRICSLISYDPPACREHCVKSFKVARGALVTSLDFLLSLADSEGGSA